MPSTGKRTHASAFPRARVRQLGIGGAAVLLLTTFVLVSCSESVVAPLEDSVEPTLDAEPVFDHIPPSTCPYAPNTDGEVDLTFNDACAVIVGPGDDAFVEQSQIGVTGTGVFAPFVRIQAAPTQEGHNTSGRPLLNDENSSPNWTRDLNLAHVPQVTLEGIVYREFRLDINQSSSDPFLTADVIKVFKATSGGLLFSSSAGPSGGTLVWDLDAGATLDRWIRMNYNLAPGSGKGDMFLYVPDASFAAPPACDYNGGVQAPPAGCNLYVYLWSEMGERDDANDGFEEWSVRVDINLDISKTATATFDREYIWEIEKTATPDWDLFNGDQGESQYSVVATVTSTNDTNHEVTGTITIINASGINLRLEMIQDLISKPGITPFQPETITCSRGNTDIPVGVPLSGGQRNFNAGTQIDCTYSHASFGTGDLSGTWTNTVTVTATKRGTGQQPDITFQDGADATFEFSAPTNSINQTVSATDTFGGVETVLGDATAPGRTFDPYERTFSCPDDAGTHTNTARLIGEGDVVLDEATASVTVNCYAITVAKDAATAFDREWDWDITKAADQTTFSVGINDMVTVNYTITAFITGHTDSGWKVSGKITITNPNPALDAELTGVADLVSGSPDIAATVTCPSLTVPKKTGGVDGKLECTYTANLPDVTQRTNTATATQQHHRYDYTGAEEADLGTSDHSGTADVIFDSSTTVNETDRCADVTDTFPELADMYGSITVCENAGDATEYTFTYSKTFGDFQTCDTFVYDNTATIVEEDTYETHTDTESISITVICQGCTLTYGYWKTHSKYGPSHYDATWAGISPSGEDSPFFLSGQTYYEVLQTSPGSDYYSGNAYYILAHQYIAAELNQLSGASIWNGALTAFNQAKTLFETYTPAQIGAMSGSDPVRAQFIALAMVLDDYNNGVTGPGHCSVTTF